jgi:putative membrane protein
MITRRYLRLDTAIRYSWKNIFYSLLCAAAAWVTHVLWGLDRLIVPIQAVGILGTALAIILGFRNTSTYERWWEARKIWGGIVNESRTFTRQALTIVDHKTVSADHRSRCEAIVRAQIAWVNALRLQLRDQNDPKEWREQVGVFLTAEDYAYIMSKSNRVTQIAMLQGYAIKEINAHDIMDIYSYIQIDDTLTRLTDLQGRCERIKSTPLPRPYDYYTLLFLNLFILFFPFAFIETFISISTPLLIVPLTVVIGWIFYQIYVFGRVMSLPFENLKTDVALTSISNVIEIDLKEIIDAEDIPEKTKPKGGAIM